MYSGEIKVIVLDREGKSSYKEWQNTITDVHCYYGITYEGEEIGRIKFTQSFPTDSRLLKEAITKAIKNYDGKNHVMIDGYKEEIAIENIDCWHAKNFGYFLINYHKQELELNKITQKQH